MHINSCQYCLQNHPQKIVHCTCTSCMHMPEKAMLFVLNALTFQQMFQLTEDVNSHKAIFVQLFALLIQISLVPQPVNKNELIHFKLCRRNLNSDKNCKSLITALPVLTHYSPMLNKSLDFLCLWEIGRAIFHRRHKCKAHSFHILVAQLYNLETELCHSLDRVFSIEQLYLSQLQL